MRKLILAAAVSAVALANAPAAAAFTNFTSRAAFEAASGPVSKETFNSYVSDTDLTNKAIDFGAFKLTSNYTLESPFNALIDAPPILASGTGIDGTSHVRVALYDFGDRYSDLVIEFASPIKAFGGNFASGDTNQIRFDVLGEDFTAAVSGDGFFGFTSETAFTRIVLKPRNGAGFQMTMDNLTFSAATPGVPEPASWAMMIAGFGLAGAAMRTRPRWKGAAAA